MRTFFAPVSFALLIALLCTSCAPISKQAKADLANPIDCSNAQGDIQALQSEKASVAKQISAGLQDIVPTTAVVHLFLEQNYMDGWSVASGSYNKHLANKIDQIKSECEVG